MTPTGPIVRRALDGPWRRAELVERLGDVVAGAAEPVADLLLAHFPRPPWGDPASVADEVARLPGLPAALAPPALPGPSLRPAQPPIWRWPVAPWTDVDDLARALDLTAGELAWFADRRGWLRRDASRALTHYRYRWWATPGGGARLLEAPKPLLAERQRRVLRAVLERVPPHPAAHGFVRGRSVTTFAAPHAGAAVVGRVDLEGFFTTVTAGRVAGLLTVAGYHRPVAEVLAGLLTTATPVEILRGAPRGGEADRRHRQRVALAAAHLPQGAPSSPAAANAVAHGLDVRLTALAASRGARYTRYADDLAFSGSRDLDVVALLRTAGRIVVDEGFRVHPDKTRVMRAHRRQRLAGLVVNERPAPSRAEYDRLRAILHRCTLTGPDAQNHDGHPDFAAHLRGRIAWVATGRPARERRLLALWAAIRW